MTNINIPSGRGLILTGDRQRAGRFVGIAKRRMYEMKQMMRIGKLKYMKRVYYLDRDCVWVHLTSIDGADFTRIHSCAEGVKCSISLTTDTTGALVAEGGNGEGVVVATVTPKDFTPEYDWGGGDVQAVQYFIDWGDGVITHSGTAGTGTGSHTYWTAGIYTVSVIGFPTFNSDDTVASELLAYSSVVAYGRSSSFHAWQGALQPDRDEDVVNTEAHADCISQGWATTTVSNGIYMQQICSSEIGPGWDDEGDLGSWGFYGYRYTQRYSVFTYNTADIVDSSAFLAWVGGGCQHAATSGTQQSAMDADDLYERLWKPHDKLKFTINGVDFLPTFENASHTSLFAVWLTDVFEAIQESEVSIFTITVGSWDDFASVSPTLTRRLPRSKIAPEGYQSGMPRWPYSASYNCKASKTYTDLITVT